MIPVIRAVFFVTGVEPTVPAGSPRPRSVASRGAVPDPPAHWPTARRFEFGGIDLIDTICESAVRASRRRSGAASRRACTCATPTRLPSPPGSWRLPRRPRSRGRHQPPGRHARRVVLPAVQPPSRTGASPWPEPDEDGPGPAELRHFLLGGTADVLVDLEADRHERYPRRSGRGRLLPTLRRTRPEETRGLRPH